MSVSLMSPLRHRLLGQKFRSSSNHLHVSFDPFVAVVLGFNILNQVDPNLFAYFLLMSHQLD